MPGNPFEALRQPDDAAELVVVPDDDTDVEMSAPIAEQTATVPDVDMNDEGWRTPGTFLYEIEHIMQAMHKPKPIGSPFGLDHGHARWTFDDHTKKRGPAVSGYPMAKLHGAEEHCASGPERTKLFAFLLSLRTTIEAADTVYICVDNRPPWHPDLQWYHHFATWLKDRCRYIGPYKERTTALYLQASEENGLMKTHYLWASVFILEGLTFLYPQINFTLIDTDCVPISLFETTEMAHMVTRRTYAVEQDPAVNRADIFRPLEFVSPVVILVSEYRAEINAGMVIVTKSANQGWLPPHPVDLIDAFHRRRNALLASSIRGDAEDLELSLRTGFAGSPVGGVGVTKPSDFAMIWALMGEFAGATVWPLPETTWPKSAHPYYMTDEAKERRPSFVAWARPSFEQAVLPSLSLIMRTITIAVIPGDGYFNSQNIPRGFMRPAVVHAYGNIKSKVGRRLEELKADGMVPMLLTLLGAKQYPPAWQVPSGVDIAPGAKLHTKHARGLMSDGGEAVHSLMSLWTRAVHPYGTIPAGFSPWEQGDFHVQYEVENSATDSQTLYSLPEEWNRFRDVAVRELLLNLEWSLDASPRTESRLYCTGLGGPHPEFQCQSHFQLECSRDIMTYGGSMTGQDDFNDGRTHWGRTPAAREYATFLSCSVWMRLSRSGAIYFHQPCTLQ